jgi:endonuclease IV
MLSIDENNKKKCVIVESNEVCNEFMIVIKEIISCIHNNYDVQLCMLDDNVMAFVDLYDNYNEDEFDKVFNAIDKIVEKLHKLSYMECNAYC